MKRDTIACIKMRLIKDSAIKFNPRANIEKEQRWYRVLYSFSQFDSSNREYYSRGTRREMISYDEIKEKKGRIDTRLYSNFARTSKGIVIRHR